MDEQAHLAASARYCVHRSLTPTGLAWIDTGKEPDMPYGLYFSIAGLGICAAALWPPQRPRVLANINTSSAW